MATARRRVFNLLKPYAGPETSWDKVYNWIVGRARYVMVAIELMVVVTFFFKVFVDIQAGFYQQQIGDLQTPLDQLNRIVLPQVTKPQQKADSYVKAWNAASDYSTILTEIVSYIDNPSSEVSIRINGSDVRVFGDMTLNEISAIELKMKASDTFVNAQVSLTTDVGSSGQTGQYAINAALRNTPVRTSL